MASIPKIKRDNSIRYRVQIRRKGFSSISRIFESKELALNFAKSVENDREKMLAFGEVKNQIKLDKLVDDFTFHCIRHSTASYLAQQGVSLIEISSILGHKQIQVTMRYSHLAISNKQKLIEKYFGEI